MSSTSKSVSPVSTGFIGQAIAGLGAILCLLFVFGTVLPAVGVTCLIAGVIVSASHARHPGPFMVEWWTVLAIAALVCLAGFAVHYWLEVPGNILLAAGAVTALVAVGMGAPPDED